MKEPQWCCPRYDGPNLSSEYSGNWLRNQVTVSVVSALTNLLIIIKV